VCDGKAGHNFEACGKTFVNSLVGIAFRSELVDAYCAVQTIGKVRSLSCFSKRITNTAWCTLTLQIQTLTARVEAVPAWKVC
jgi:hypothetical protein